MSRPLRILAVDTSTLTASVAVVAGTGASAEVLAVVDAPSSLHSENLLPLIADCVATAGLTPRELDAFAVGAGPGSFTGLRIGMATAKGLAYAAGRPLWAVSSLAALAQASAADHRDGTLIVAALDARRGEVFAGCYRVIGGRVRAVTPERVLAPAALAVVLAELIRDPDSEGAPDPSGPAGLVIVVGDALAVYGDGLADLAALARLDTAARPTPSAAAIALLALAGDRVDVVVHGAPAYIRPSEVEVKFPGGIPGALARKLPDRP